MKKQESYFSFKCVTIIFLGLQGQAMVVTWVLVRLGRDKVRSGMGAFLGNKG